MSAPLADLARRFQFGDRFLDVLSDGFEGADWTFRPEGGGSSALWILGHVTATRRALRRKLGEELPEEGWEAKFGMNTSPDDLGEAPSGADLVADFKASGEPLASLLVALTPEQAAVEWEHPFPDGSQDVDGAAHFFYFHEVYHLGQLGLIRRMRGKERFA